MENRLYKGMLILLQLHITIFFIPKSGIISRITSYCEYGYGVFITWIYIHEYTSRHIIYSILKKTRCYSLVCCYLDLVHIYKPVEWLNGWMIEWRDCYHTLPVRWHGLCTTIPICIHCLLIPFDYSWCSCYYPLSRASWDEIMRQRAISQTRLYSSNIRLVAPSFPTALATSFIASLIRYVSIINHKPTNSTGQLAGLFQFRFR